MKTIAALVSSVLISAAIYAFIAHAGSAYVTLNTFSGKPGVAVGVSGGGWTADTEVHISIAGSPTTIATTSSDGTFASSVHIPENASGPTQILVSDKTGEQATNSYYAIPFTPSVTITSSANTPFSVLSIQGSGFAAGENVLISFENSSASTTTDDSGNFSPTRLLVLSVTPGLYTIHTAGQKSGARVDSYFYVGGFYATVSPSTYYALPGQRITFTGSGFSAGETISISENGTSLVKFSADSSGSFAHVGEIVVPVRDAGGNALFILHGDRSNSMISIKISVQGFFANSIPSSYYIAPGQTLNFSGSGFAPGEKIKIMDNSDAVLGSVTADASGGFKDAGNIVIPLAQAGSPMSFKLVGTQSNAESTNTINIAGFNPVLRPSLYYLLPGQKLTLVGSGFAPHEAITIRLGENNSTSATADNFGNLKDTIVPIPLRAPGSVMAEADGMDSHTKATVLLTIGKFYPTAVPNKYYLMPGDTLSFTGAGFVPGEEVSVGADQNQLSSIMVDETGVLKTNSYKIPFDATGHIIFTLMGLESKQPITTTVTIATRAPYLNADNYFALPGTVVHVHGNGFAPNEKVAVASDASTTEVMADANGVTPDAPVSIPFNASTAHVVFSGSSSGARATLDIGLGKFFTSLVADTYYTAPGSTIHIQGQGFAPHEPVNIFAGNTKTSTEADENGATKLVPVILPMDTTSKQITILANGVWSEAQAALTVTLAPFMPVVTPSTYYTTPGSRVIFTGSGFAPGETIPVQFNGNNATTTAAERDGTFIDTAIIPYGSTHADFSFTGNQTRTPVINSIALAQFYPALLLNTYYAAAGAPLSITGIGFGSGEEVPVIFAGNAIATPTTDSDGTFTLATRVPGDVAGTKAISGQGSKSSASATTVFDQAGVYTTLTLSAYAGTPGSAVTFIGAGYVPGERIEITSDRTGDTVLHTLNADATGSFTDSGLVLPDSFAGGNITFTAKAAMSFDQKSIIYYIVK